ncbi:MULTISPECIES: hypothetical protein [Methylomonas]|uniref:Uncharacterized protein n=1 Tax=Methylomonas koyamae TaxID=702114 RepID=A0A177NK54_9GAMM|nr:hypothetical protein [Methylomonas koyamae]OAI18271.1 hypothetical protein A1355_05955 [Methylomonas koyamae]
MTERYVHALWCDDIRQEIGNKPSFMGAYVGGITVPLLPTLLPRLSVYVWVTTAIEHPFEKAIVKITRDDGFLVAQLNADNLDQNMSQFPQHEDAKNFVLMFGISLSGVELPDSCKYFTVSVETESETLEGPKLRVSVDPDLYANPKQ